MSGYSIPRPIVSQDDLDSFECGEADLNEYLRKRAIANHRGGAGTCYITEKDGRVVGYFVITMGSVQRVDATHRVGNFMPDPVPVVLLARLAVDQKEQGHRLGAQLLRAAIVKSVEVSELIGARAILVHALHDRARTFYQHFGFEASPTDPLHLFLLMKDARKVVVG